MCECVRCVCLQLFNVVNGMQINRQNKNAIRLTTTESCFSLDCSFITGGNDPSSIDELAAIQVFICVYCFARFVISVACRLFRIGVKNNRKKVMCNKLVANFGRSLILAVRNASCGISKQQNDESGRKCLFVL